MKNPIIIALDNVESLEELRPLVQTLAPHVGMFKVGLELITRFGTPTAVDFVHNLGGRVFLDGKFNDIPNTVAQATKAAVNLGVEMFNLHASCGLEAMRAAASVKGKSKMLAVTVLTSLTPADIWNMYVQSFSPLVVSRFEKEKGFVPFQSTIDDYLPGVVESLALQAKKAGADGIICSPQELERLYYNPKLKPLIKVTPGVRPEWADTNDQKRVMTPAQAIIAGADYLVIGRPITKAKDRSPAQAAQAILEEITPFIQRSNPNADSPK